MSVHSQVLFNYKCLETELGQESVQMIARLFLEDTGNMVAKMKQAVKDKDAETVRFTVHMLKGCCRSIVALSVEEYCEALEDAACTGDWTSIAVGVNQLGPLYQQLREEVMDYIKGEN